MQKHVLSYYQPPADELTCKLPTLCLLGEQLSGLPHLSLNITCWYWSSTTDDISEPHLEQWVILAICLNLSQIKNKKVSQTKLVGHSTKDRRQMNTQFDIKWCLMLIQPHSCTQWSQKNQLTQDKKIFKCTSSVWPAVIIMTKQTQQSTQKAAETNPIFEKDHITSFYDKPLS